MKTRKRDVIEPFQFRVNTQTLIQDSRVETFQPQEKRGGRHSLARKFNVTSALDRRASEEIVVLALGYRALMFLPLVLDRARLEADLSTLGLAYPDDFAGW